MMMSFHPVLPSSAQGMTQGEYAMCSSSVMTVTLAEGSHLLASEAAVMPAAPEPMTMTFFDMLISEKPHPPLAYISCRSRLRES